MFIDTSFNTVPTVLANLHQSFHEAAVRCFAYARSLSRVKSTPSSLLIKTIDSIIGLAFVMLQRRTRAKGSQNLERVRSAISRRQIQWLACKAFGAVFQRRQTQHRPLLAWLDGSLAAVRPSSSAERRMLEGATTWRGGRAGAPQSSRISRWRRNRPPPPSPRRAVELLTSLQVQVVP
ncbi:hypothetical protein BDV95DRAFT_216780 [Massariosphaeria phaeospora]|uniref:Telomerase reverse transcriptase n=1 Tax=Massariosphaeria phaeospora TaxID=100035 RepID=A0A7C8MF36_9PLEO|nr:hypothetical protein BDV95DRAFT_216780 [Massariosphaeria phaeospora]